MPSSEHCTTTAPEQDALELLEVMLLIRAFEERAIQLYNEGLIRGAIHSSVGQEAVAAGTSAALRVDDYLAATHRGHGHAIAKGAAVDRLMAELMGRSTGYCGGKGGSMHVCDLNVGMLGANGIVGASAELATGAAFAVQVRGGDQLAVAVLGDGGMAEGAVYESMNLAALWRLPVVFLCENNRYAVTLSVERSLAAPRIGDLATAHGIPVAQVDGMDVLAVREAMAEAAARARDGAGPSFIEAQTYRYMGHSRGDPNFGPYRTEQEWEEWHALDPIPRLVAEASLGDTIEAAEARARERIEQAVQFATSSASPTLEEGLQHVFPSGLAPEAGIPPMTGAQVA